MKRKILSCLLVTVFALLLSFSAAAAEPNTELMISLGVFSADYTDSSAYVTRAEFISAAVRLFGWENAASSCNDQMFYDVTNQNASFHHINFASKQGYISGTEAGYFSPDDIITDVQAVKVVMSMLGYDVVAREKGGYPSGYVIVANQVDLLEGVGYTGSEAVTLEQLALIFKNALNVRMITGYTVDGKDYFETGDDTLLSNFDLDMTEGVLESAGPYSVLADDDTGDGRIRIDGKVYAGDIKNNVSLLGKTVEIYYKKTSGSPVIAAITESEGKNSSFIISCSDIAEPALAGGSLKFYENDKIKSAKLASDIKVVYNGRGLKSYSSGDIYKDGAMLTFIDNDDDSNYDVVFVQNSVIFRINSINASQGKIYMENLSINGNRALELDDAEAVIIRSASDDVLGIEGLAKGDWISAAVSDDAKVMSITVLDNTVTGIVEAIAEDEQCIITIDGKEYAIRRDSSGAALSTGELRLGIAYTFILDEYGMLCRIDDSKAQLKQYGYIIAKRRDNDMSADVYVKLLVGTTAKSVKTGETTYAIQGGNTQQILELKLADRLRYNGSGESSGDVYDALPEKAVVEYMLNVDGEIRSMEPVTQYYDRGERISNCRSRVFGGVSAGAFGIDDDTVVFFVPTSGIDDDYYANMQIADKKKYITSSYGFDTEDYTADACVIELNVEIDSMIDFNDSTPVFALQSVRKVLNEDGDAVYKLGGYLKGQWQELQSRPDKPELEAAIAKLDCGDLLYYSTDNLGNVNAVKPVASFNLKDAPYHTGVSGIEERIWGVITSTRSKALDIYSQDYTNNMDVAVGNEQMTIKSSITDGADCYRFDYAKGIYTPVDFSELPLYQSGYEHVFVYMRSSSAKVIVAVE